MNRVNRSAIVLHPRQRFADWVKGISASEVTLSELQEDHSCYLLPEMLSTREMKEYFEHHYERLWEEELSAWTRDPQRWPPRPTFTGFLDWFTADFHTMVTDLGGDPLWATDEGDEP